jgi:hypothetical protein
MNKEKGELNKPFNEEEFIEKLKDEVIDKFNINFLDLQ